MQRIIISRTDSIGDVILTLPLAGALKQIDENIEIIFLAKKYTQAIIETNIYIDKFLCWDEIQELSEEEKILKFSNLQADAIIHVFPNKDIAKLALKAKIKLRIGTSHRLFHILKCNKLLHFGRKKSNLHEAQLNLKLISPLGGKKIYSIEEIENLYGLSKTLPLHEKYRNLLDKNKFNLILHPKSKGSAREWGLDNFSKLINKLPKEKFKIFISGTKEDGDLLKDEILTQYDFITDLTGKMNLTEFISFISKADGLVAASTGPLHIAAALGINAIGLYAPMRPIHPQRWSPIGKKAKYFVLNKKCNDCRKTNDCHCIREIKVADIISYLENCPKINIKTEGL